MSIVWAGLTHYHIYSTIWWKNAEVREELTAIRSYSGGVYYVDVLSGKLSEKIMKTK